MEVKHVRNTGRKLRQFLRHFDDCFTRSEPRDHLHTYVRGQLSDLPRKSIEPIALAAGIPPRTLQYFLSSVLWDHPRLRDRIQWLVARDHAYSKAIGVIDETGNPKKGKHTCGVQRQWCGHTGKVDNCVVGVHLAYVAEDFHCLLDSDLYLPESWAANLDRRETCGVPDTVGYRKKTDIALGQIARALKNGIRFSALTFDAFYGRDHDFLDGLDGLGQNYVGEIPSDFSGWLREPEILLKPTPAQLRKRGRKRQFPRLSHKAPPACEVRNLRVYSRVFQKQTWKRFRIKDGEKGPMVWEVKYAPFYRKHGERGLPGPAHTLMIARNVLDPNEVKYFLSNLVLSSGDIRLEWLLWVAFSRWPIERCFEIGKRDLGMDHFEVRTWQAIHRHFYISQLSQLFCARVHQGLREKNVQRFLPDGGTGSHGRLRLDYGAITTGFVPDGLLSAGHRPNPLLSTSQPTGSKVSSEKDTSPPTKIRYKSQSTKILCAT